MEKKSKIKAVGNMNYMTEREYNIKLEKVKAKNDSKLFKAKLKAERNKYKKKKKIATSKLVLLVVFLVCIEIILYSQFIMIYLKDTTALYVMIGAPVTLIPIVMSYYSKSKAENTASGIVYETAMRSQSSTGEIIGGGEPMPEAEEDVIG